MDGAAAEGTKAVYKSIAERVLPRHLAHLERLLADGGTGWIAGTPGPSIADFTLAPRLQWLASGIEGIPPTCLDSFPGVPRRPARPPRTVRLLNWNRSASHVHGDGASCRHGRSRRHRKHV